MINRYSIILNIICATIFSSLSVAADLKPGGYLLMYGSRTLNPETKTEHNLDVFLGFADINFSVKTERFEGFTEVYLWPAGYGFSYIESAVLDSSTNLIVTKESNESRLEVINAWGRFTLKNLQIMIGRALLKYSNGFFFGDYLQKGSGPIVDHIGNIQNCIQFQNTTHIFTTSLLLGVDDINLDKGYLTVREMMNLSDKYEIALGYQGNIFDLIHDPDAEVLNNMSISARLNYFKEQNLYAEFGLRGLGASNADMKRFPFMVGISAPTGNILTNLSFEIEYDNKREEVENFSSFCYGITATKGFNDHFLSILSLNNGSFEKPEIVGLNLEIIISY